MWLTLNPAIASELHDTRLQLHHAAQLASAFGSSFLAHKADDSHTNLEWLEEHRALASNALGDARVAIRVTDLTLLLLRGDEIGSSYALGEQAIEDAASWLRGALSDAGIEGTHYSLARHYEMPAHPVANGDAFAPAPDALEQLARWFGNAAGELDAQRAAHDGSPVRCWPHHFDIATLITVRDGVTIGAGMEPGDVYYHQPYFYVNASPQPSISALSSALDGGGTWHTHEWIGAVLPASGVTANADDQATQVRAFFDSAVRSLRSLVS